MSGNSSQRPALAAFALIIAATSTAVPDLPRRVWFVVFGVVFVAVCGWMLVTDRFTLTARPAVLGGALAVWAALAVGFVRSPTVGGGLRLGAFVVFTGAALFVLPSAIPRRAVYRATAIVGGTTALLALPTVVVGQLGTLDVFRQASLLGVPYHIPRSIFGNPNLFASVVLIGALTGGGLALTRRSDDSLPPHRALVLAVVCVLALVLLRSRSAQLALVAGAGVLVVAHVGGRRPATLATVGGLTALGIVVAAIVGVIPRGAFAAISFTGRPALWNGVIRAVAAHPLVGWGPGAGGETLAAFVTTAKYAGFGPHSSFFRFFFIGGIVGGLGFLVLVADGLRGALASGDPTTAALVVATVVFAAFQAGAVFGLAPLSFVSALAIGYAQRESDGHAVALPANRLTRRDRHPLRH